MGTNNKFIAMLKRNYSTIIIGALALVLLFVPEAKAMMQQGLMKLGLFEPKLEKVEPTTQPKSEANYTFEMVYADGKAINMEDLKGKVVFMNFWATWCAPCVKELPYFEKLNQENPNVKVILVSLDFEKQVENKLIPFLKKKKIISTSIYLADKDYNSWLPKIDKNWSGSIPATVIFYSG